MLLSEISRASINFSFSKLSRLCSYNIHLFNNYLLSTFYLSCHFLGEKKGKKKRKKNLYPFLLKGENSEYNE